MLCIGNVCYNIGLKCKYAKISLTTKMIQRVSLCKTTRRNEISNKTSMLSISTTLSGVISHAGLFLLARCGTLGRRSRNPEGTQPYSRLRFELLF